MIRKSGSCCGTIIKGCGTKKGYHKAPACCIKRVSGTLCEQLSQPDVTLNCISDVSYINPAAGSILCYNDDTFTWEATSSLLTIEVPDGKTIPLSCGDTLQIDTTTLSIVASGNTLTLDYFLDISDLDICVAMERQKVTLDCLFDVSGDTGPNGSILCYKDGVWQPEPHMFTVTGACNNSVLPVSCGTNIVFTSNALCITASNK